MQTQSKRQMNAVILFIICVPLIEVYLMIKVGGMIGAFNTIFLIFFTAITGVYFARLSSLSEIRSGINQLIKKKIPIYEIISGAALAFAALRLQSSLLKFLVCKKKARGVRRGGGPGDVPTSAVEIDERAGTAGPDPRAATGRLMV